MIDDHTDFFESYRGKLHAQVDYRVGVKFERLQDYLNRSISQKCEGVYYALRDNRMRQIGTDEIQRIVGHKLYFWKNLNGQGQRRFN